MSGLVAEPIAERAQGRRPGRLRAVVAALGAGVAAVYLMYKFLRSEPDGDTADPPSD
jgi:hypothetical protein